MYLQRPSDHIRGNGCPVCRKSLGERKITHFLVSNEINYKPQYKFDNCKNIYPLPFDFYLPEYNTCIEFQGLQHYKPVKRFGGESGFKLLVERDKIKSSFCMENNIVLCIIKYTDNITEKLKSIVNEINNKNA